MRPGDVPREWVEAGARELLHDETNGLCDLGQVCGLCDCFAHQDGGAMRDGFARGRTRSILAAVIPHIKAAALREAAADAHTVDRTNPDALHQYLHRCARRMEAGE